MLFGFYPELLQWNRRQSSSFVKITGLDTYYIRMVSIAWILCRIFIIEILNKRILCKSYRQRIHRMMPMVIPFCPILYSFDFSSVLIFVCFHKTQGFIFRQVQFFHYIHQLPVFTQLICNGTGSCHYSTADFVQHSECFFRYILCISQIPINETIRYILLFHFQFPKFRLFVIEQAFATIYILLQAFFSIFFFYKIISGLISLFYINSLILQCLVR